MFWAAIMVGWFCFNKTPDLGMPAITAHSQIETRKQKRTKDSKEPLTLHHVNDLCKKLLKLRRKKPKKYKSPKPDILYLETKPQ